MLATWGTSTGRNPTLDLQFAGATSLDNRITFSRGSQATLFDSTGALVYAKHNLVVQSQTFQTTWTTLNSSVSADSTIAPDGTATADKLVENTATSEHYIEQSATILSSGSCTASVYIKADTRTKARVAFVVGGTGGVFADADLTAGTIGAAAAFGGGTAISSAIHNMGNGWYRCVITGVGPAGTSGAVRVELLNAAGNRTYTGDGTSGLFIWGAQLNQTPMEGGVTSSLSTYYPTVASAYYAPRFDYSPSTLAAQGLLIEEQRTNSIRNNTMQGAVAGTPGTVPTNWAITTTSNGLTRTISTGTENGINYVDIRYVGTTTAASFCIIRPEAINQVAAASGQSWTSSVYMRVAAGSTANIVGFENWVIGADAGGAVTESTQLTPAITGTMTRFAVSRTMNNASTAFVYPYVAFTFNNGAAIDITLRIGLPQLEQGAFATSVIPTTTTALTRNADVASMTGTNFSSWFNAADGTFVCNFLAGNLTANGTAFEVGDGGLNNRMNVEAQPTVSLRTWPRVNFSGSLQVDIPINNTVSLTVVSRTSLAYQLNNINFAANGTVGTTDTSCTIPTVDRMQIGNINTGSGAALNGWISRIAYYPVRLPNSTLQALTA